MIQLGQSHNGAPETASFPEVWWRLWPLQAGSAGWAIYHLVILHCYFSESRNLKESQMNHEQLCAKKKNVTVQDLENITYRLKATS